MSGIGWVGSCSGYWSEWWTAGGGGSVEVDLRGVCVLAAAWCRR